MHEVEFVSARFMEMAAAYPGMIIRSRPVMIERRFTTRRAEDRRDSFAHLLRAAFPDYKA